MDRVSIAAHKCISMGLSVIPIAQNKMPAVKWKACIDQPLDKWVFPSCNLAILTGEKNGVVVVDCDNRRSALMWLSTMKKTPLMVKTARGMHFYYRHPGQYIKSDAHIRVDGWEYDVKGDRSYVLAPPSERNGHRYEFVKHEGNPDGRWISPKLLPVFEPEWRPVRVSTSTGSTKEIADVRAYIKKIFASEGERDKLTYRVCKIAREAGLSESEATGVVVEWHMSNCNPPWDAMDIVAKVKRVYSEVYVGV